jgi:hypothetical protein
MKPLHTLLAALALSAVATAQIALPPHASVYNGYTRGFNFTAQTSFYIVQLDLPTNAFQAGDTAGYMVRVNGAMVFRSVGNATSTVPTSIQIVTGDVVDILGNWSPATPGSFTAHNSYGSGAPFATTIEGVPHTLNRCGWQWDISDPLYTSGTYLAPGTGSLGRILVTTSTSNGGGTLATTTSYGQGCYKKAASFYESFSTAISFDLANSGLSMVPGGGGYVVLPALAQFVAPSANAVALALTDDSEAPVTLSQPFPHSTGVTSSLTVCSNGFVSVATGNGTGFTPAAATMLAASQTGWWTQHDFNPAAAGSGQVKFEQIGGVAYITWDNVYDFSGTTAANANLFQFQFDCNSGVVHMIYGTMSSLGGGFLVGYSPGGASLDPGNTDISVALPSSITLLGSDMAALAMNTSARPRIGTTLNIDTSNIQPGTFLGATLLGFGQINPGVDLGFLGAPGCSQYLNPSTQIIFVTTGASYSQPLTIPNDPSYVGLVLYGQGAAFTAGLNSLGVVLSNGIAMTIGNV